MALQVRTFALILILLKSPHCALSARILFFMGLGSHSHRVAMQPLADKLALVGHDVTFLSPIKPEFPHPNITEFRPKVMEELNRRIGTRTGRLAVESRLKDPHGDPLLHGTKLWDIAYDIQEALLRNEEFIQWCRVSKFDLVIVDYPTKEIAFALAYKAGAKIIAFGTGGAPIMSDTDVFGLPIESYWLPDWTMGSRIWFLPDHFAYTYNALAWYFSYTWYYLPKLDQLVEETLGEVPPLEQLLRNADLTFLNEHYSTAYGRALPPSMVAIGGMHIREPNQTLPEKIQDFLGDDEFIFISLGSIIKVTHLPEESRNLMLRVIKSFKDYKFLWKWENSLTEVDGNVMFLEWFPQNDLLGHPKCKGFVSQGGALSLQQAAYHGVPVIAIPVWGDQGFNARAAVDHGNGILLELLDINEATFSAALNDLLHNERYALKAQEVSVKFKDRPMTAQETAYWWTEYVLRHNDTSDLRPLGAQLTWWQRRLLDFWICVLLLLLSCLLVTNYMLRVIFSWYNNCIQGRPRKFKIKMS